MCATSLRVGGEGDLRNSIVFGWDPIHNNSFGSILLESLFVDMLFDFGR